MLCSTMKEEEGTLDLMRIAAWSEKGFPWGLHGLAAFCRSEKAKPQPDGDS